MNPPIAFWGCCVDLGNATSFDDCFFPELEASCTVRALHNNALFFCNLSLTLLTSWSWRMSGDESLSPSSFFFSQIIGNGGSSLTYGMYHKMENLFLRVVLSADYYIPTLKRHGSLKARSMI